MPKQIGIDLGGTKIAGVRLAPDGRVEASLRRPTPQGNYQQTVVALAEVIGDLRESADDRVGIGTPGVERPADGRMKNCNSTWLNGQPLRTDLEAEIGQPVRLANDANCFALAEAKQGAGAQSDSVFGVILGTGVGGGIVIDGKLVNGASGLAGEWGHTPLPYLRADTLAPDGVATLERKLSDRPCYCGRLNCIETFLNGGGLSQTHRELWLEEASPETIARKPDQRTKTTWHLYCTLVARSLAQIANIIDPGVIVIGGGLSNASTLYPPVNEQLSRYVFSQECEAKVVAAHGGDAVGAVGAAWLWPQNGS